MSRNQWNDDPGEINKCLNDSNRTKTEKPTIVKRIWRHFQKYTGSTSIHGLQYIGEDTRTLFERIWWSSIFLGSIILCGYFIYDSWYKWKTSPVIVSFAESMTPIWMIPFPAVTICPQTKVRQTVFNFTNAVWELHANNITDDDLIKLNNALLVCGFEEEYAQNKFNSTTFNETTLTFLKEVSPPMEDLIRLCQINGREFDCSEGFGTVLTSDGFCYTFNGLHNSELLTTEVTNSEYFLNEEKNKSSWSLEHGYLPNSGSDVYPYRGMGSGERGKISFILQELDFDVDDICQGVNEGYKIYLHHPGEIPTLSSQYFHVPLNQHVVAAIEPNMMTTTDGLRSYSPEDRQCFFPHERKLRFYKEYTQNSCESECVANYTLNECGCLPFFLPAHNAPICNIESIGCKDDALDSIIELELEYELDDTSYYDDDYNGGLCNCLPSCMNLKYNAEVSQGVFNWFKFIKSANTKDFTMNEMDLLKNVHMTMLSINFKSNKFITSKRSELYSVTDFLANCGGLLGLFMGFSILSLVEILYFCSIRVVCSKIKKENRGELEMTPKTNI